MKRSLIFFLLYLTFFCTSAFSQWIQQRTGLQQSWNTGNAIDVCDSNTAIIAVDNILFETEDAGNSWRKVIYPLIYPLISYVWGTEVSIIDKDHFWVSTGAGEILATSDGGTNWSVQFYDTAKTQYMDYVKMFDLNKGIAIGDAVGNNSFLFLTTSNGGKNWVPANYNKFNGGYSMYTWRPISFINQSMGYFNNSYSWQFPEQLLKTTDNGKSWIDMNYNNYGRLIKFYNENLGFVVGTVSNPQFNFAFNRTTDGGNSWETFYLPSKDNSAYPTDIEFVPGNPSKVWFVNNGGSLYYSSDTGRTWTEQKIYNGPLHGEDIIFTDSTHGWLLCDSGKVFYTSNNGGMIAVDTSIEKNIPSKYLLMQNYPNPFNPTTTINYQLPQDGFVTLKVYDALGREVATLVDEYQKAGTYSIDYEVKSSELASGIYFYKLTSGSYSAVKKMVVLK